MSERLAIQAIQLSIEQCEQLFQRIESRIEPTDYELIVTVIASVPKLLELLSQEKHLSKSFERMLFGKSTEKIGNILPPEPGSDSQPQGSQNPEDQKPKRRPGHGRNGLSDYPGAKVIDVVHPHIHAGDICPACSESHVYDLKDFGKIIILMAQPIFIATAYRLHKLRCGACNQVFTAPPPPEAGNSKYDPSVGCQLALLHYGFGMPMTRIETLQKLMGVPLPIGTQCEQIQKIVPDIEPVFHELEREAAQSGLFHTDDTHNLILDVAKEIKTPTDAQHDSERKRTGIFTTGILARSADHDIVLYYTGRQHAGENLSDLLAKRSKELSHPILMCDALSRNLPKEFETVLANCIAHGRRQFIDIVETFPKECRRVLEDLSQIYHFDAQAREQQLTAQARLDFHQVNSRPIMDDLHGWIQSQFDHKLVEPNSRLGKAFKYMLNHWQALTRFLTTPGAPLDNNLAEQVLKKAILKRKNSLFYKTTYGAYVGDVFMSIIQTCQSCGANAFEYLKALVANAQNVKENPKVWMPWNYKSVLSPQCQSG